MWHNGLRYKLFMLDLRTKMTRWLSDFLIGRVIQVNVNGFLSDEISPIGGHHRVLSCVDYFSWYTSMTYQNLTTNKTRNPSLLILMTLKLLVPNVKLHLILGKTMNILATMKYTKFTVQNVRTIVRVCVVFSIKLKLTELKSFAVQRTLTRNYSGSS